MMARRSLDFREYTDIANTAASQNIEARPSGSVQFPTSPLDGVSGATKTSDSYAQSVQSALDKAGIASNS